MNNYNFSTFSELEYKRPDFDHMAKIWQKATEDVNNAKTYEEIRQIINAVDIEKNHVSTMMTIASIRNTLNTTDEFYEAENEYNETMYPAITEYYVEYAKALINSPFSNDINEEYGTELLVSMQREIDSFDPVMVPYMQKESMLCNRYQKIMATAKIPFRGNVYNLHGIRKFFENSDREGIYAAFCRLLPDV